MKTKNLVVAASAAFALAVFAFNSNEAAAQCGYGGYGYSSGYGSSFGYGGYAYPRTSFSIGIGNYNRYPSYSYYGGHSARGHYDYHPPTAYRHGNHLHVSPGHFDYHRGRHHGGY